MPLYVVWSQTALAPYGPVTELPVVVQLMVTMVLCGTQLTSDELLRGAERRPAHGESRIRPVPGLTEIWVAVFVGVALGDGVVDGADVSVAGPEGTTAVVGLGAEPVASGVFGAWVQPASPNRTTTPPAIATPRQRPPGCAFSSMLRPPARNCRYRQKRR